MKTTYDLIEDVLKMAAGKALAPHEFDEFSLPMPHPSGDITRIFTAREYVGQSESAIGRRLREMRELKRVTSQRREGTAFVEYALVVKAPAIAPCHEPELAGQHSGGL